MSYYYLDKSNLHFWRRYKSMLSNTHLRLEIL